MIKNLGAPALVLLAGLSATAGCREKPKYPNSLQGVVELDERDLGFEVGGRVREILVHEGDPVQEGQVLARLDDSLERLAREAAVQNAAAARSQASLVQKGPRREEIGAAAAQVEAARAKEQLLETNLKRQQRLLAGNATTPASVEELEARHRAAVADRKALEQKLRALRRGSRSPEVSGAEAKAAAATASVKLADERLSRYELHALGAGTVLQVDIEPGETVAPGAPVFVLADTDHPYADVFVPQGSLDGVRVGAPATVHIDATDHAFTGRVEYIARRTEFTPRYLFSERERPNLVVRVRVRIDDPDHRLHAGVPAFVTIERRTASTRAP